jgi:energy-converting hydrogenase Eha subunit C
LALIERGSVVVVLAAGGMAIHALAADVRDPLLTVLVLQLSLVVAAETGPLSRS